MSFIKLVLLTAAIAGVIAGVLLLVPKGGPIPKLVNLMIVLYGVVVMILATIAVM